MTYIDGAACWRSAAISSKFVGFCHSLAACATVVLCCAKWHGVHMAIPGGIALAVVCVYVLVFERVFERGHLPKIYSNNLQHLNDAATYLQHIRLLCFL